MLLDLTMPKLSGQETFRKLRQLDPEVRVLFASGYCAEEITDEDRALIAGFVPKPYKGDDLARTIRGVLDGMGHEKRELSACPA